jgi:O-antigen/teichoic acid export membrane protein
VTFGIVYLAIVCGDYKTGLFATGVKLSSFAILPISILQLSFAPTIARYKELNERQNIAKKYSTMIICIGAIISSVMFFFPEFCIYVSVLGKESFLGATLIVKIIAVNVMFFYIANTTVAFFYYWGFERKLLIGYIFATISYVIATSVLINLYQAEGAAFAMWFSDGILACILIFFLYKILNQIYIFTSIPLIVIAVITC